MKPPKTWGSIFNAALRRGYDHGYAAHLADGWEKRMRKNGLKPCPTHGIEPCACGLIGLKED